MSLDYSPSKDHVQGEWKTFKENPQVEWLVMGFEGGSALKASSRFAIEVVQMGAGPVSNCHSLLQEDQVQFVVVKLVDDHAGHFDSKYVFTMWSGQRVKPLLRARCSGHKDNVMSAVEQALGSSFSGDMVINSVDDLVDSELRKKVFGRTTRRGTSIFTGDSKSDQVYNAFSKSMSASKPEASGATQPQPQQQPQPQPQSQADLPREKNIAKTDASPKPATQPKSVVNDASNKEKPLQAPPSLSVSSSQSVKTSHPKPEAAAAVSSSVSRLTVQNRAVNRQRRSTVRDAMRSVLTIDKTELEGLLKDIHDPEKPVKWCLLSYNVADNVLRVTDQGNEECLPERSGMNDRDMQYIVININMHSEIGYGADNTKTIFITWIGPNIPGIRRARCVQHKGEVFAYCNSVIPIAAEQQITTEEEFDIALVRQRVAGSQGRVTSAPKVPVLSVETVSAAPKPAGSSPAVASAPKEKRKSVNFGNLQTTVDIENEQALIDKLLELRHMCSPEAGDVVDGRAWAMLSYIGKSDTLQLVDSGEGHIDTLQSQLPEEDVRYMFYKTVFGNAPKIVVVTWIGSKAKGKRKAISTAHRSALQSFAEKHAVIAGACELTSYDEVKDDVVESKITGTRGSPRSYTRRRRTVFGGQSQDLQLSDKKLVEDALRELNDDENSTTFLLFGYKENGESGLGQEILELRQKGEGTSEHIKPLLSNDQVQFVLLKILVEEEGYGGSPKVVLVTFVPPAADMFQKAKSSTDRIALKAFSEKILSVGGEHQCMTLEEFNDDAIKGKITGSKGRLETSKNTFVRTKRNTRSQTVFKRFGGGDSTLQYDDMKAVEEAFNDLKSDSTPTTWLMFGYYSDEEPNKVSVLHRGSGGVDNFKQHLKPDNIMYIVRRLSFMEYHEVCKVILVTWVGEDVDHWGKAKSSGHRVNLYEFIKNYVSVGGEFQPLRLEDLTDNNLIAKITGSRGDAAIDEEYLRDLEEQTRQRWEAPRQIGPKAEVEDHDQFTGRFVPIEFSGKDKFKEALLQLDERMADTDYVKLELKGKSMREVAVEEIGAGSLTEEWSAKHLDTARTLVFVFAITTSEAGYGNVRKYALALWVGNDVKHKTKAKANELRQSLFEFANEVLPMAAELHGSLPEHITRDTVLARVMGTGVRGREMLVRKKSERFASMGRGNWQLKFADQDAIVDALRRMVNEEDTEVDWVAITYTADSLDTLQLHATGAGRNLEWKSLLKDDNIVFVAYTIDFTFGYKKDLELLTGENHGDRYFGMCLWLGPEVNHFELALTSHHFNKFQNLVKTTLKKLKCSLQGSHLQPHSLSDIERPWVLKIMNLYD